MSENKAEEDKDSGEEEDKGSGDEGEFFEGVDVAKLYYTS